MIMKDYGKQRSTVQPEPLVIDEYSVWIHSDIVPVEETNDEETFIGFEFNMVHYENDEYIKQMSERNTTTELTLDTLLSQVIPSLMV